MSQKFRPSYVKLTYFFIDSCMAYHANTIDFRYNKFTALKFKPICEIDGSWRAKQCKGGVNGR